MAVSSTKSLNLLELLPRLAIPCVILVVGWFGFRQLASEVDNAPPPKAEDAVLRSRVEDISVVNYPVVIKTHAIVQPHNQVALTAQVSGKVVEVSPQFEVGAYFKKGDTLVVIDPRDYQMELASAQSELLSAESELELAKIVEDRKLKLVKTNAVSQGEVASASATREQAVAKVALAETKVDQAKLKLERTEIIAPFDGRVMSKLIGIGQLAGENTPLGDVFAIDYVEVRLPISGEQRTFLDLPEYADDAPLQIQLRDGILESNDFVWSGKIVRTEGVLDPDSRDVFAIARIEDPFGRLTKKPPLRIGHPVIASIEGQILHDVVALPRAAVRQLDHIVLVNRDDQTLKPLKVNALWTDAEHVIVASSAIPDGMLLATTPMPFTPDGAKVEIIPPTNSVNSIAESTPLEAGTNVTN